MRYVFLLLAFFATAAFAQDAGTPSNIKNICDTLSLGDYPKVTFVPAYIDESNWFGNPHTWQVDSTNNFRHESFETVQINPGKFTRRLPVSVSASCFPTMQNAFVYAGWNSAKKWVLDTADNYATVIRDTRQMGVEGYDSLNSYNLLAMVKNSLPEDDEFNPGELLVSRTYEFSFEWWYVTVSYRFVEQRDAGPYTGYRYASAVSYDSSTAAKSALDSLAVPDTIKAMRIQAIKAVLKDSRKLGGEECSSSVSEPSSSSMAKSSSSVPASSSSKTENKSSSSTSDAKSSSSTAKSSSSAVTSSSSGGSQLVHSVLLVSENLDAVVQMRRLDGSKVLDTKSATPGIYYVKTAGGVWMKKLVLRK